MKLPPDILEMDREQFDAFMLEQANAYSVCEFLGRGKYSTHYFVNLEQPHLGLTEARDYRNLVLQDRPDARLMIYGMIVGPHGVEMNIFVE